MLATLLNDAALSLTGKPARTIGMGAGILLAVASATTATLIADTQQYQIDLRFDLQRSSIVVLQAQTPPSEGFPPHAVSQITQLEPVSSAGELSIWADSQPVAANPYTPISAAPLIVADSGGLAAAGVTTTGMDPKLINTNQPLVWIGTTLANRLGLDEGQPNTILINARPYTIAGTLTAASGFGYLNTGITMGRPTATKITPIGKTIRLLIGVRPGAASTTAQYAQAILDPTSQQHLVDATPPDGQILQHNVAGDLRTIGLALGGFIGLVGMIAVANTMSMTVNQRYRELGLRAAMGWTPNRIRTLILTESTIAGLAASIIGCTLGITIAITWALTQQWQPIILKQLPAIVITLGTLASLTGGLIPAQRAGHIPPITAMRN